MSRSFARSRLGIHLLVLISGLAALSWEVLWQVKSSLALGVSAWGTAIALAVTMGGMSAGSLITGHVLREKTVRPLRLYGVFECVVGICGLFLSAAFRLVEQTDTIVYATSPDAAPIVYLLGIAASFGIPAMCLGATLPVIGLAAQQYKTSIALLYGLNTLGAACGALIAAFILIPLLGIKGTIWAVSAVNLIAGATAILLDQGAHTPERATVKSVQSQFKPAIALLIVFITGFVTFVLEVSWFRSLTAAFMSTTDAFAIMLSCVLISLSVGAALVPFFKNKIKAPLGSLLAWSGITILLATPVIERFDLLLYGFADTPYLVFMQWFSLTLYVVGAPVLLLGVALPWILDDQDQPQKWGKFYGLNAFAAIIGALSAGWIFLPMIGFAKTAWMAGTLVAASGLLIAPRERRVFLGSFLMIALLIAVVFESGVGRTRVQGTKQYNADSQPDKVLGSYEGPDATVSAVEYPNGWRLLYIDGFVATSQGTEDAALPAVHYMDWMGHLPMLLQTGKTGNALVICFGTGQTANAVRRENPQSLDIVDINKHVFDLAKFFPSNDGVLDDERVKKTIMDGRAYIRRTDKTYDVITLEPMPPTFAGVNALYSQEFYQHAREKMGEGGVIAQWLPFHIVPADYSAAVVRTFQSVFPNAILWIDPLSTTGILLGSVDDKGDLGSEWPGLAGNQIERSLSEEQIRKAVLLNRHELEKYGAHGEIITDDNQLLAYGRAAHLLHKIPTETEMENFRLIKKLTGKEVD